MPNKQLMAKSKYKSQLEEIVRNCEAIRRDPEEAEDISLAEYLDMKYDGLTPEQFYEDLGLNPTVDTIQMITNLPDTAYRWLIPELFRDALRLGLRKNPIYPSLIAAEQSVSQLSVTMPAINMSEAMPRKVGIAETITLGTVSFDQKTVKIYKYGRGIKVPYEVIQYVPMNLVAIFLQDFGVKMGIGLDSLALTTAVNGDQANGSDSAAVIGINDTAAGLSFRDLLKMWVRASRIGRSFANMVAGEDMAVEILELLTNARTLGTPRVNVTVKTPIPQNANIFVHGAMAANQALLLDPTSAMIKLNAQPLLVETEKIIQNQTQETFATFTTGFATIYRDARLILDISRAYSGFPFPTWMDPSAQEQADFE